MSVNLISPIFSINLSGNTFTNLDFSIDVEITMNTSFEADTFSIRFYNIDSVIQSFIVKKSVISITLGYQQLRAKIITGIITNISDESTDDSSVIFVQGIDLVIWKLKENIISLSINNKKDVLSIIRQVANESGVLLSSDSALNSGIILDTYTENNKSAFYIINKLIHRIGYNVTAKGGFLVVTENMSSNFVSAVLSESINIIVTKSYGTSQDNKNDLLGYNFESIGLPSLIPMRIVTLNLPSSAIMGNFLIESVIHEYNSKLGYMCRGLFVQPDVSKNKKAAIQYPSSKTFAKRIVEVIESRIENIDTINFVDVEQLFTNDRLLTSSFGINKNKVKSIVNSSIEAELENNAFLNKKPISSIFAGNGYGLIVPIYQGNRGLIVFNDKDSQDANLIGLLWKKGWTIPEHDEGDYMLHHRNHSKYVMKDDGSEIKQVKSLKIEIGNNGLTISKPTKANDGDLEINFDDGSHLKYDGSKWILNTSGSIEIGSSATSVKLAGGGKKVGRLGDNVAIDSTLLTWLNTHTHPTAATGPPSPPTVGYTGSNSGQISQSSIKTEVD